jgi:hypothetical protein
MMKSRKMRWAGHGTRMGDVRSAYKTLAAKPLKGGDDSEDVGIGGKIIL